MQAEGYLPTCTSEARKVGETACVREGQRPLEFCARDRHRTAETPSGSGPSLEPGPKDAPELELTMYCRSKKPPRFMREGFHSAR